MLIPKPAGKRHDPLDSRLILFGVEAVAALADRRAGYVLHLVWVGALGALLALTLVRRVGWDWSVCTVQF